MTAKRPRVVVSNYGVGDKSVLLVNKGILDGVRAAGLLEGDIVWRGPVGNDRYGYEQQAATALRRHVEVYGAPDMVVGQACFALALFRVAEQACPDAVRVLQRDSTHERTCKELVDAEMVRCDLPISADWGNVTHSEAEYESAHVITVLSHWVERTFIDRGMGRKLVYVGPQTAELMRWRPGERPDDGVDFRVMVAGQMRVAKGTHMACRAWSRMGGGADDQLVFSGHPEPQAGTPERLFIDNEVKEAQANGNVRVIGWGRLEEMPLRYAACDVYCLPSFQEGSSMTCVEAMLCGRPVVATENSGSDLLEEHNGEVGFMVPAGDDKALADAFEVYRRDPELRRRHGTKAREVAMEAGGSGRFAAGYARALENVWSG